MDGLTNEQRAKAWLASWHPSFTGKAIVNKEMRFTSVNQQFCDLLGMMPGDFLDHTFTDMTPEPQKTQDMMNAHLVVEGRSSGYLMEKQYIRADGTLTPKFMLLVVGVFDELGEFLFFVSRIILSTEITPELSDASPSRVESGLWVKFLEAAPALVKIGAGIAATISIVCWALWEMAKLTLRDGLQLWHSVPPH